MAQKEENSVPAWAWRGVSAVAFVVCAWLFSHWFDLYTRSSTEQQTVMIQKLEKIDNKITSISDEVIRQKTMMDILWNKAGFVQNDSKKYAAP